MRIIPVLDLKDGLVVRGVAGKRALYQPIVSKLCSSAEPVEVASSLRGLLGTGRMYLADLDAISGVDPAVGIFAELESLGRADGRCRSSRRGGGLPARRGL